MSNTVPIRSLLLILFACTFGRDATAQVSSRYTVTIPPYMSLRALRGPASSEHPLTSANVVLDDSRWFALTASTTGSTVTFVTDHAFWNSDGGSSKRDAILRISRGFGFGGWNVDVPVDQTNHASGDEVAQVSLSSSRPGLTFINMEVEFVTDALSTLQAGSYELTVTGTISAN